MSFNKHGNIELAPTTTKAPVPFVVVPAMPAPKKKPPQ